MPPSPTPLTATSGQAGGAGAGFSWQSLGLEAELQAVLPELIQLRRHLHRHPELSGHEQQTAALVAGELRRWGWQVREGVGRTGVLAELGPAGAGPGADPATPPIPPWWPCGWTWMPCRWRSAPGSTTPPPFRA